MSIFFLFQCIFLPFESGKLNTSFNFNILAITNFIIRYFAMRFDFNFSICQFMLQFLYSHPSNLEIPRAVNKYVTHQELYIKCSSIYRMRINKLLTLTLV